jgi:hypothetical protein
MIKPDERVSDLVLERLKTADGWNLSAYLLHSIVQELLERRRGEWICPQCGLRNGGNAENEQT